MFARCTSAVIGSPRLSSAFPPSATTTRIDHSPSVATSNALIDVQTVLGLLECDVRLRLEHVVGDFDAVGEAVGLADLLAEHRLHVVKRRQAMHELHLRVAAGLHQLRR